VAPDVVVVVVGLPAVVAPGRVARVDSAVKCVCDLPAVGVVFVPGLTAPAVLFITIRIG
jgi:hypothetical protein